MFDLMTLCVFVDTLYSTVAYMILRHILYVFMS